ncbi:MAG: type I-C CRISPR-associated protein Cas7/Csd2 [Eubacteriales bacterium]|nr:type I-C CRISPR-associated protein Cas7/Csd2 [Eubacteriales bacterium]
MNKIDFIMLFTVENANGNGDPLAENMPRTDSRGYGEVSDVCIKRKIRNRWQDEGFEIFVKSKERSDDGCNSLEARYKANFKDKMSDEELEKAFNQKWLDVRAFGQVITYDKKSIGIRGPVSISIAKSLEPITIESMQITKSVNGMEADGKSSDTMGTKHYVPFATYVVHGAINAYFAEKTGFTEDDAKAVKEALKTLFVNDASSARPEGSMEVQEIYWFEHSCKIGNVSSAKIKALLKWDTSDKEHHSYEDYNVHLDQEKLQEYKAIGLTYTQLI